MNKHTFMPATNAKYSAWMVFNWTLIGSTVSRACAFSCIIVIKKSFVSEIKAVKCSDSPLNATCTLLCMLCGMLAPRPVKNFHVVNVKVSACFITWKVCACMCLLVSTLTVMSAYCTCTFRHCLQNLNQLYSTTLSHTM